MNQITVQVQLCEEDRAKLDRIAAKLDALCGERCQTCVEHVREHLETAIQAQKDEPVNPTPEAQKDEPVNPAEEHPVEAPFDPTPEADVKPSVTADDLQKKIVRLVTSGKKAEARAIVNEYAERVSEIPADKRAEVFEKLTELEG